MPQITKDQITQPPLYDGCTPLEIKNEAEPRLYHHVRVSPRADPDSSLPPPQSPCLEYFAFDHICIYFVYTIGRCFVNNPYGGHVSVHNYIKVSVSVFADGQRMVPPTCIEAERLLTHAGQGITASKTTLNYASRFTPSNSNINNDALSDCGNNGGKYLRLKNLQQIQIDTVCLPVYDVLSVNDYASNVI